MIVAFLHVRKVPSVYSPIVRCLFEWLKPRWYLTNVVPLTYFYCILDLVFVFECGGGDVIEIAQEGGGGV